MRHGKLLAVLAVFAMIGCTPSKPLKDMVGYVPPTSLPAQPKRTLVAEKPEQVWAQLVDFLETSAFKIDHIDEEKNLLVARYSGNPEPYIDCGSIVTHQNGTLGQIAGSAPTISLNYEIEEKPVVLNRALNLDSRIIIKLADQPRGTIIQTDTTYVVTKTIDVTGPSGTTTDGNRETVSFEAGGRGEFSKGTACQPNGSLDLAVLQSLPNIVGSNEIDRAELPTDGAEAIDRIPPDDETVAALPETVQPLPTSNPPDTSDDRAEAATNDLDGLDAAADPSPAAESTVYDWVLPEQGLPTAALPASEQEITATDARENQPSSTVETSNPNNNTENQAQAEASSNTVALAPDISTTDGAIASLESPTTIVDDTTRKLLASLDCSGEEWHFCDLVEVTTPYRKRNIEKLFGLTVNTTESFTSQVVGRDLKLDILFPSFPSHLHIAYARRDGTVDHVMSSSEAWPADLAHQLAQSDQTIPGPPGLAMIVAIATDKPLFSSPPADVEDAAAYLDRLKQRLAELENDTPDGSIAASQLLIYVENAGT
ncbi:MAG: hypothetical protein ACR2P3_04060 [Geminicoccaceae bacterium]